MDLSSKPYSLYMKACPGRCNLDPQKNYGTEIIWVQENKCTSMQSGILTLPEAKDLNKDCFARKETPSSLTPLLSV